MTEKPSLFSLAAAAARDFGAGAPQALAILAAGMAPGALLVAMVLWATGLTSQDAVEAGMRAGLWAAPAAVAAAEVARRSCATFGYCALVFALEARRAGRPLRFREAFGYAAERFVPFVLTALRAAAWIAGGLILLIVPGLILAARYCLSHLAVLVEDRRGAAALERSAELVSAEPARALGFLAAALACAAPATVAVTVLVSAFCAAARGATPPGAVEGQVQALLSDLAAGLVGAALTSFALRLYDDLASRRPLA